MTGAARSEAGFTYIGVLLFLAVFGALSAGVVSAGANLGQRAAEEELMFVGSQFRDAIRSYYEAGAGGRRFALTLEELLRDPRFPGVRRHLRRIYLDPLTGKDDWGIVQAPGGGIMGVYSKASGTPLKVSQFSIDYVAFEDKKSYADWVFAYVPPGQVAPGASIGARPAAAPAATTPGLGAPPVAAPLQGMPAGAAPGTLPAGGAVPSPAK